MRKKLIYCVEYRNMHTAIHGLISFNSQKESEVAYNTLMAGIRDLENANANGFFNGNQDAYELAYQEYISDFFDASVDILQEINFRDIEEKVIHGELQKVYDGNMIITNRISIDLYI